MVSNKYVPQKGDLITLQFNPQAGHEQQGRRPALVISNQTFNRAVGMVVVCPLTNTEREIPFHIPVPKGIGLTGYVMVEQVKSVDFKARNARYVADAPLSLISEVLAVLDACLYQ